MDSNDNNTNEKLKELFSTQLEDWAEHLHEIGNAHLSCPHCNKTTLAGGRFCARCGREIAPFVEIMQSIKEIQDSLIKTGASPPPSVSPDEKVSVSSLGAISLAGKLFADWSTLNRLCLFGLFSYLCLFGTALSEQRLGAYIIIAATFGISASLGKAHAREFPRAVDKRWIFSILGALFGTLILFTQFGLQSLLTDNFVWPEGQAEGFETFNTVLGVTFAYLAGAMLNDKLPAINSQLSSSGWIGRKIAQYRQAFVPLILFAVTVTPKIMSLL